MKIVSTTFSFGMPSAPRDRSRPVFLRVGTWNPAKPYSNNYAKGEAEHGLSVYELDGQNRPIIPSDGEWAEEDLGDRLRSKDPKLLVQGDVVARGGDGEPLLQNPVVVGVWS